MHRHRRHRSKVRAAKGAALLVAIGVAAGFWVYPHWQSSETAVNGTDAISQSENSHFGTLTDLSSEPGIKGHQRLVFGHSLVPGGIHSIEQLANLTRRDPKLAEHYQDFNLSKGRVVTLDHALLAFVSYRLDGGIYWEARPTMVAKGEQVLTDGSNLIRVRCGNRIVDLPHFPTSRVEPADMDIVVGELTEPPDGPVGPPGMPVLIPPGVPVDSPVAHTPPLVAAGPPPPTAPIPTWPPTPPIFAPTVPIFAPTPPIRSTTPLPPSPPFGGDEFANVSLTILGHSRSIPTGLLTLLAGVTLAIMLRLVSWRS